MTLNFIVIGRSGIAKNVSYELGSDQKEKNIKFRATSKMMPQAEVYVYYIHWSGEVVFDRVDLFIENDSPNEVSRFPF